MRSSMTVSGAGKAPARAEIQLALGIAQEALGNSVQAEMFYRTAYALEPKSPEIVRHLAAVLGKEQHRGAAITYWREAVALAPYDFDLKLSLATSLMDDNQNAAQQDNQENDNQDCAHEFLRQDGWAVIRDGGKCSKSHCFSLAVEPARQFLQIGKYRQCQKRSQGRDDLAHSGHLFWPQ